MESVEEEEGNRVAPRQQDRPARRWLVLGLFVVLLSLVAFDYVFGSRKIESGVHHFFVWVQGHPRLGFLAVVLVYIVATVLFIPGGILTVLAGYALGQGYQNVGVGILVSTTAVFVGASIGSICSFLLGRYMFREWVQRLASNYALFQAIDRALQANGLKIMLLLRLSPLIPFNALDYISGITSISLKDYVYALVGILPGAIAFCAIGATASSFVDATNSSSAGSVQVALLVVGTVFAIAGVGVASYYSKRELDEILSSDVTTGGNGAHSFALVQQDDQL